MISLFALTIGLCACSKVTKTEDDLPDYISFNQLTEGYEVENAVDDDCVVFVDFKLISGEDIWKTFMTKAGKKQSCCVRIARYCTKPLTWQQVLKIFSPKSSKK